MIGTMVAAVAAVVVVLLLAKKVEGKTVFLPPVTPAPDYPVTGKTIPEIVIENANKYKVDPNLIHAHIQVESSGDPNAINPSDPSYGLMGITPILAKTYGYISDWRNVTASDIETIKNPVNNIAIGTRFLSELHSKYPFDIATQMYNCGEQGYKNGIRVPEYLAKVKRYYNA